MDFLTLNFGQLLYLLEKNTIRNFEKQKKQIISARYGIFFNQTCLNEELCPAYSNILYIYNYFRIGQFLFSGFNISDIPLKIIRLYV